MDNIEDEVISEEQILDKTIEMGSGFGGSDGHGGFKLPSLQEVMDLIDKMEDISEEERENLKSNLIFPDEQGADKLRQQLEGAGRVGPSANDYILFFAMLGLVALVFALFGYKLYKSLMEKQLKKQEKQKVSKKSKKTKQK